MFALKRLLEKKGHKVIIFSMHHPQNFQSEYSKYFVSYINYDEEVRNINIASGLKVLKRTVYSREARKMIEHLITNEKPDIAHVHNIHHYITPSIFYPFKKHKIPIIWTLHDYTLICPNTSFLSHGRICERCRKIKYFWPPLIKCKKNSLGASVMATIETTMHRLMRVNDLVDLFIAPSDFLRKKVIEYGFKEEKVVCLHHFIDVNKHHSDESFKNFYLYVGRISEEKGVKTLIDAAVKTASIHSDLSDKENVCRLKIAGSGPLLEKMIAYSKAKDENGAIDFVGHKSHDEVMNLIRDAKFVVVPSEWYENYPFAILETFACGKPAIGSKIGGIPELIRDAERGLVFRASDSDDLSSTIRYLLKNPDIAKEMGKKARVFIERELNGEKHYEKLIEIYNKVFSKYNKRKHEIT
jgi:glycosyltransferase involved in cell wall biosynthesis